MYLLQCSDTVGWATGGHPACKTLDVGLLVVMILRELCTSFSSSCHHSPLPSYLASIKPANPGSPGKMAAKGKSNGERVKCTLVTGGKVHEQPTASELILEWG